VKRSDVGWGGYCQMSSQGLIFFSLMIIAFVPKTSTTNSAVFQRGKSNAVAFLF